MSFGYIQLPWVFSVYYVHCRMVMYKWKGNHVRFWNLFTHRRGSHVFGVSQGQLLCHQWGHAWLSNYNTHALSCGHL